MATAFDTETWPIQPGLIAPRLVVCTVAQDLPDGEIGNRGAMLRDDAARWFRAVLPQGGLVAHNAVFDLGVFAALDATTIGPIFDALERGAVRDTMLRERLLRLSQGELKFAQGRPVKYGLSDLVWRYFSVDLSEDKGPDSWRTRYAELDGVPLEQWPAEALRYALDDPWWTLRVYHAQTAAAARYGLIDSQTGGIIDEAAQLRSSWALHLASMWGLRSDPAKIDRLAVELAERVGEIDAELIAAGVKRADGSLSVKALEARLTMAFLGEPPRGEPTDRERQRARAEGREPVGNILRDAITLTSAPDPLLKRYGVAMRPAYHLRYTLPELRAGAERPICPRYTMPMATGRTSSSGPNCQKWPRKGGYRECLRPRPGHAFVWADYGQLELCTLAQIWLWLFGESSMADSIRQGRDLHLVLAAELVGLPYEALSKATHKDVRDFCKEGNYGFPVGMGAEKFLTRLVKRVAKGEVGPELGAKGLEDCKELQKAWRRTWPESRDFFAWIEEQVEAGGTFRQWVTGRVRGGCEFTDLGNSGFQGLAADGATLACWLVQREAFCDQRSGLYGSRLVAFVHDELLLETPLDRVHEAGERLSRVMVGAMERYTPDVPIEAEACASLTWSKAAKPKRDSDGRLVLWAPEEENYAR